MLYGKVQEEYQSIYSPRMGNEADDVSLPKATVQKVISEVLDPDLTFSKEAREIIIKSGIEFIMILSSMASEMAENDAKKTIAPEHVIKALEELEYVEFIPFLEQRLADYKGTQRVKEKRDAKFKKSGLSEEELLRQQEALFRQSRSRLHQTSVSGASSSTSADDAILKAEEE